MKKRFAYFFLFFLFFSFLSLFSESSPDPCLRRDLFTLPDPDARTLEFYQSGNRIWILFTALNFIFPALLYFSGLARFISDRIENLFKRKVFIYPIWVFLYLFLESLLYFPFRYYSGFVRMHEFGLSNQSFIRWLEVYAKSSGFNILGGIAFLWIPLRIFHRWPRHWWWITGSLALPFLLFLLYIQPVYIDPFFNRFTPMEESVLRTRIQNLAEKTGVGDAKILVVDRSRDTGTVNAYVTGFGGSRRIVFWDTIFQKLDPDEVLFVTAHEIGHYRMNHILYHTLLYTGVILLSLFFVDRWIRIFLPGSVSSGDFRSVSSRRKFLSRFLLKGRSDPAILPLLIFLFTATEFFTDPAMLAFSRWKEKQADLFALKATNHPEAAVGAFLKLQKENLANPYPGPVFVFFRASHPPPGERVLYLQGCSP